MFIAITNPFLKISIKINDMRWYQLVGTPIASIGLRGRRRRKSRKPAPSQLTFLGDPMRQSKLKSAIAAVSVASAALFSGVSGATPITLNPDATNGGAGKVNAGQAAFSVDNILTTLSSVLDISSAVGAGTWNESGAIVFTNGTLNNVGVATQWNALLSSGVYDIYGVFLGGGSGSWVGSTFLVSTVSSFTIDLYAAPGGMAAPGIPGSGIDATGGVTIGATDLLLGTATFSAIGGLTAATLFGNGSASTALQAIFDFQPNPGFSNTTTPLYTDGFFAAPVPFEIGINGSGSSNVGQSTWAPNGAGVRITTGAQQFGTANLTFVEVPTPGTLALVGLALTGMGVVARRRKVAEVEKA
jgi:hypothetical protein